MVSLDQNLYDVFLVYIQEDLDLYRLGINGPMLSSLTFFRVCIQTKSATSSLYTSSALAARNIALYFPAIQLSIPFAGARSTRKVSSYPDFICSVGLLCDQIITSVFILWNEVGKEQDYLVERITT